MLFPKQLWEKTSAFMMLNEILLTKLTYLTEKYPQILVYPEAHDILDQIQLAYHGNVDLLDIVTDNLQEMNQSRISSLTEEEEEHRSKIRNILNQIYSFHK